MRSSIYEAGFDQVRFILSHFHAKDEHFDYLMYCSTCVCSYQRNLYLQLTSCLFCFKNRKNEKKRSERRKHCALTVVRRSRTFSPRRRPPSGGGAQDGQNFISWRCHYLHLQTQFGEDRCTQFRVIVVTDPQTNTHKHTHKQTRAITIHRGAKLSAQCKSQPGRRMPRCRPIGLGHEQVSRQRRDNSTLTVCLCVYDRVNPKSRGRIRRHFPGDGMNTWTTHGLHIPGAPKKYPLKSLANFSRTIEIGY